MRDTFRIRENICPYCNKKLDACSNMTGEDGPDDGDFTLCLYCAAVLRFNNDLTIRPATRDDMFQFSVEQPELFNLLLTAKEEIERKNASASNRTRD